MISNDDAFDHEDWVERRAIFGSRPQMDLVVRNAKRGDYLAMVTLNRIPANYLAEAGYSLDAIKTEYKKSYDPNKSTFAE